MKELKFTTSNTISIPNFFGKLFQLRDQTHLCHLAAKSYAIHMALGSFYDELLDLIDGLIESYQGKYGIQSIIIPSSNSSTNELTVLKAFVKSIDDGDIYSKFKETYMQNQIDEITKLVYSTIYKLENLK